MLLLKLLLILWASNSYAQQFEGMLVYKRTFEPSIDLMALKQVNLNLPAVSWKIYLFKGDTIVQKQILLDSSVHMYGYQDKAHSYNVSNWGGVLKYEDLPAPDQTIWSTKKHKEKVLINNFLCKHYTHIGKNTKSTTEYYIYEDNNAAFDIKNKRMLEDILVHDGLVVQYEFYSRFGTHIWKLENMLRISVSDQEIRQFLTSAERQLAKN